MAVIGATELQPVNVVSNYLAGRESRQNQLAQQQEMAVRQQQMAMQQRAAQREEEAAAAETRNALARRQALATGDPSQIAAAGFVDEASKLSTMRTGQNKDLRESREFDLGNMAREADALANDPSALNMAALTPWVQSYVDLGVISPEAAQRFATMPDDPQQLSQAMRRLSRQGLTASQQAEMDRAAQTAAIQRGQLEISAGNLAVSQRGQSLQERKFSEDIRQFGIKNQQELDKLQRESPETLAKVEQMKAAGRYEGERLAKARLDLPDAIAKANEAVRLIDEMIGKRNEKGELDKGAAPHPGFKGAVGFGLGQRFIPGTDASGFQSRYDQVTGSAFLQAYETLKGTGQITEIEGAKATSAITRMQLATSEKEFISAAREFRSVIREASNRRAAVASGATPAPAGASRQTASGTSYTVED